MPCGQACSQLERHLAARTDSLATEHTQHAPHLSSSRCPPPAAALQVGLVPGASPGPGPGQDVQAAAQRGGPAGGGVPGAALRGQGLGVYGLGFFRLKGSCSLSFVQWVRLPSAALLQVVASQGHMGTAR